ncbi:MAG TPA: redoxin domain-containing protein [Vicinamibacterales bacterium]|nr:redoxin domain-containing protein [Vicinamibacterales bacterium]
MTESALKPGTPAPEFTLPAGTDKNISLKDFRGRPVVLAFYPADFSPVCSTQLSDYTRLLPEIESRGATILGVSVDGVWCHTAFARDQQLGFPLLSDSEPKGAVARQYGVYREQNGITERALFVIDRDGIVRWSYVSPIAENPGAEGMLKALQALG